MSVLNGSVMMLRRLATVFYWVAVVGWLLALFVSLMYGGGDNWAFGIAFAFSIATLVLGLPYVIVLIGSIICAIALFSRRSLSKDDLQAGVLCITVIIQGTIALCLFIITNLVSNNITNSDSVWVDVYNVVFWLILWATAILSIVVPLVIKNKIKEVAQKGKSRR